VAKLANKIALTPMSPLNGIATPGRFGRGDGTPGVTIAERDNLGLATLAVRNGQDDALTAAVREAYGVDLPAQSSMAQGKTVSVIGYGPGQWLVVSETLENEALAEDLATRLTGFASISDQSGGRAVLRVSGPRVRDVLAKGLGIDLDPRVFPAGSAVTSTVSHMGVQLWHGEADSYDIAIFRSVSASFWHWLTASAAEYGYEVVTTT